MDSYSTNFAFEPFFEYEFAQGLLKMRTFDETHYPRYLGSYRPEIALKGFRRVFAAKGETVQVSIPLNAADLEYWDIDKHAFVLEKGKVKYFIGSSSEDFKLHGEILVE
jgi:hypothetical protein